MVDERDVQLSDGRTVHVYDSGPAAGPMTILWHHGSPQTGALLDPVLAAAGQRTMRLVSYGRPGYGGSTPAPGRAVVDAAADCAQVMDALGVARFASMGASGGGPHALACRAQLGDRVLGVVCLAGLAPPTDAFDWFGGMQSPGGLRSARSGRDARAEYEVNAEFDADQFIAADRAALDGVWRSLGADAARAGAAGPAGLIDDDVAFAKPWGFELHSGSAPVLLVHGGSDRVVPPAHAGWMLQECPDAQLWLRPRDGHISVLAAVPVAMDWLGLLEAPAVDSAGG